MKREEIEREALIAAIEADLPQVEHFLDLRTGEVLTVVGPVWGGNAELEAIDQIALDNRELAHRVRREPERYQLVPSINAEAGFRWMQEFASSVADEALREKLQKILRDCSDRCFEAFREALTKAPEDERERWFAFRNERLDEFIEVWLEGLGL